jgi:hypothetical protein
VLCTGRGNVERERPHRRMVALGRRAPREWGGAFLRHTAALNGAGWKWWRLARGNGCTGSAMVAYWSKWMEFTAQERECLEVEDDGIVHE